MGTESGALRMNRAVLILVMLAGAGVFTGGCAGKSVSDSNTAGSGGSTQSSGGGSSAAGSAGSAAGSGHSRPAQGNLTLSIQPPLSSDSGSCPVPGHTYVVGNPKGPNSVSPGDRLIDGEDGVIIECSVRGKGPYTISGTIQGNGTDGVNLSITDGVIDTNDNTGTASVSVYTSNLGGIFSGVGCTLAVVNDNVKSGSIWATVYCPTITSSKPGQACAVGPITTVVFENCDGT
jgi:hypothetical protein